jgi:N-acetylglutamate synthase-like GNAT family acetyltransferase
VDALTIRAATAEDAPALGRLLTQLGYPTEAAEVPERLEKLYSRPGTAVLVADRRGETVGCVTVHLFQSLHVSEPVAWLTTVVVDETTRGKGVGSALVKRAEEWAIRHGALRMSLTSALRRKEAHEFYKARDYEHTGVRLTKIFAKDASRSATAPSGRDFHVMEFAHHDEAAAFVAALSRFLESPDSGRGPGSGVEVWARSPVSSEGVRLFLSDEALAAAQTAFSPVPVRRTVRGDSLPDESFLIIEGGVTPAWGAAEASAKLSPTT